MHPSWLGHIMHPNDRGSRVHPNDQGKHERRHPLWWVAAKVPWQLTSLQVNLNLLSKFELFGMKYSKSLFILCSYRSDNSIPNCLWCACNFLLFALKITWLDPHTLSTQMGQVNNNLYYLWSSQVSWPTPCHYSLSHSLHGHLVFDYIKRDDS